MGVADGFGHRPDHVVDADLSWADAIIPCGIPDAGVSSLTLEAGRPITVHDVLPYAEKHLADVLG